MMKNLSIVENRVYVDNDAFVLGRYIKFRLLSMIN